MIEPNTQSYYNRRQIPDLCAEVSINSEET